MKALGIIFIIIALVCVFGGMRNAEPQYERDAKEISDYHSGVDATADKVSNEILEGGEQRKKTQQWFFVAAGVVGMVGLILIVVPSRKSS